MLHSEEHMKIFKMNDYDWWAANSLEDAVADCLSSYGCLPSDIDDVIEDPCEISSESLDRLMFTRDDGSKVTFRTELDAQLADADNCPFPHLFASTEQ